MKNAIDNATSSPVESITAYIAGIGDWRGELLTRLRSLFLATNTAMIEDWKWGVPVWSNGGNVVSAAAFKDHVKVNFFKGAEILDPHGLFNAGLDAKNSRAIDFSQGDTLNETALQDLVRAAVACNHGGK